MTLKSNKNKVDSVVLDGVLSMLRSKNNVWLGTMTSLHKDLVTVIGNKKVLPASPSSLRVLLNRIVNRLRTRGISVKFGRASDYTRTRYVKFAR